MPPLVARDTLFGGRRNACKHFAEVIKPGDEILYYGVCSLYPWVMKYNKNPVGHPEVVLRDFKDVNEHFGLIKCKVLLPRNLNHPVLPVSVDDKLMFPLCFTCAKNRIKECKHAEIERCFTGTWVTPEIQKAVELGYDPIKGPEGLFSKYISTFQGFKQEASGWPEGVIDEEAKEKYIDKYFEREGGKLRKECVE